MYILSKLFKAEVSHSLLYHDGRCRLDHGHSLILNIILLSENNELINTGPKQGMVIDYSDISKIVKPIVDEYLDHNNLNKSLNTQTPTTENLCKWLFDKLKPQLPLLYAIKIHETDTSSCTYCPSPRLAIEELL